MRRERGFSLIEMVVALVIATVLLGLGLSSYRAYMANQKVRSNAELFMMGLQMARAEAVKLNQRVEFVLTSDAPTAASVDTATTSTTGSNWMVRALAAAGNSFIEGKSGTEGGGTPISVTGSISNVVFDGFGMPIGLAAVATFTFSNPTAGECATAGGGGGPIHCLEVRLSRGGQARMCDPAVAVTDTRSCGI
ncbi:MAG: GspH/FimT family pseudopilin [Betaproteobacteria bacterium]|nr:GspH/FimT family pseudopilin [Rhodocyclales bacterium]